MIQIVKSGLLRGKIDNGKGSTLVNVDPNLDFSTNDAFNPNIVCFCDIPCSDFEVHMKKYCKFGIGFSKDFLVAQGVRPVFYIPRNAMVTNINIADYFNRNIKNYSQLSVGHSMHFLQEIQKGNFNNPVPLDIFHFFDLQVLSFIKFFDHDKTDDDPDNYYLEREWRSLERIEFSIQDIKRIVIPSSYVEKFFKDIPDYNCHVTTV
jgi:hypothetical protein